MSIAHRHLAAALVALAAVASSACVQPARYRYPVGARTADERAYTYGYDEGLDRGEDDARRRRAYDYARHGDYRDADDGYRGFGDRNAYRRLYRQGFVAGYNDGFRRFAQGAYGRGPRPPYASNRGRGYPAPNARHITAAAENGYRDGYDQGRDDRDDRDAFDPIRASRYRAGDRGYDSRYGSRDAYAREYRAAFQQGYADGYYSR